MDNAEFRKKLNENARPVIVDLWAPWCGPCRAMEPVLQQVEQKYHGQVDVLKINADESPEVLKALGVIGIPTVLGFADGQEIVRRTGTQSFQSLDIFFEATLRKEKPANLPPSPIDRFIRSGAGVALLLLGWFSNQSILLMVAGALLLFSAFYDRCPIYQAVAPRVKALFKRAKKPNDL